MENITNKDYTHAKRSCQTLKKKNLGKYNDLYVQSDTLLLADVFYNFSNLILDIYGLDPAHFVSAPRIAQEAALKNSKGKLDLLTNVSMLLMIEKGIRGGIFCVIYCYTKANN